MEITNNILLSKYIKESYLIEHSRNAKISDLPTEELNIMIITNADYELMSQTLFHDQVIEEMHYSIWATEDCGDYDEIILSICDDVYECLEDDYTKVRLNFYSGESLSSRFDIAEDLKRSIINKINIE